MSRKTKGAGKQTSKLLEAEARIPVRLNYLLHLPADYGKDPDKRWPLILFLHGMGERGDDLGKVKIHGIPKRVERDPSFPFVTVSPQCPLDSVWTSQLPALETLLDSVLDQYAVDPARVYLTGLSMGGYGSWALGSQSPQRFAAVVPICGGGRPEAGFPAKVAALKEVPVWAFHGAKDDVVPLAESETLVDHLRSVGGDARLTVYPDCGHNSWAQTYDNPYLYRWMLKYHR
ncbi:MAG: prolyl oligopeptidase family serine peptidase [Anaerolineae bacterium]|nr:prolyl oligopeptidase family serine peptidase [Anaerolineae bacterium]